MTDPIATVLLMLATCGVSIWAFENKDTERKLIFCPESILAHKEPWRLVTSAFLHAGWGHLFVNMYTLYYFGGALEWRFGPWHFLLLYFASVIGGSLLSLFIHRNHEYRAYGASGGVCGLVFAYVLVAPDSRMMAFPLPYWIPAWMFGLGFMAASLYAMKAGKDNIGHDAHLGGAIAGLATAAILHPELAWQHWAVFLALLTVGGLALASVIANPLFLPIWTSLRMPKLRVRIVAPPRMKKPSAGVRGHTQSPSRRAAVLPNLQTTDWLIDAITEQVGMLKKDPTGLHDWIDKFGRSYRVVKGSPETFDPSSFTRAVLEELDRPKVNFVILDTRRLPEAQVDILRPFIADLPDSQFNRLLRSYAFKPPRNP